MSSHHTSQINIALGFRFKDRKGNEYEVVERLHGLDTDSIISYSIEFVNGWTVSYDGNGSPLTHVGFHILQNGNIVGEKIIQKVEDMITWINSNHLIIADRHGTI